MTTDVDALQLLDAADNPGLDACTVTCWGISCMGYSCTWTCGGVTCGISLQAE